MPKRSRSGGPARRNINRAPSPLLAFTLPWLTILVGSLVPGWLMIASAPVLPPLGFLLFLSWRQLRPGLLPIWSGLPLGLFDDLFSGQPFGAAVLLWSLAAIVLELIEARVPWRSFLTEWLVAIGLIVTYIVACLVLVNLAGAGAHVGIILPQVVISVLSYPLVGRLVAVVDRFRLTPIMVVQ
ncbi:rod shape-determining protein MreD [Novosphingobium album (ex Hu et al. 2023)]|uniref:Rod shape-determining protein MreD n=1 Tax=Novosphingobium album (ex Hu et al. 2023) TaxID=2930093 RepID=A0ABT0AXR1_9SPHN|nr:rod shape-determining protein MreD [Novosphingobium album (ex Hu et al. 2023)]MCJ2177435.1 rod shape-determining protein MreD [Novosphingobium album (ex Hu et al. 2023)]